MSPKNHPSPKKKVTVLSGRNPSANKNVNGRLLLDRNPRVSSESLLHDQKAKRTKMEPKMFENGTRKNPTTNRMPKKRPLRSKRNVSANHARPKRI